MWEGPQRPDSRGTKAALTFSHRTFDLLPRNGTDVRYVPAHASECLHHGHNHDHQKQQVHERRDNRPEEYQDSANSGDRPKYSAHNSRHYVEEEPDAAKDD